MKVWLDDVRPMPRDFDIHCRTMADIEPLLRVGAVTHISFDHDLGEDKGGTLLPTGYDVAKLIEHMAHDGTIRPFTWSVHSANPVGKANINAAMCSAERFWEQK